MGQALQCVRQQKAGIEQTMWKLVSTEQVSRQTKGSRDGRSLPSPMEVSAIGMWERVSAVLSKIGPYAKEIDDPSEVTRPQKPTKPAQASKANREQQVDKGITKSQIGKGRLKKLAREQSLTQGKNFEAQSSTIGFKWLSSQLFTESENMVARKKKCEGFCESSDNDMQRR